ncbi:hypothetical protein DPMN_186514 [Dreissena polymorpha]|uniref:Uncharacterized protein n=1 Tax=Dreissena polymorpha TaxID=45954 RepID=A0A9D4DLM3_DREPO|nr:hypothetical protein DPMN_186514 [Dreissena polymorpha]
MATGQIGPPGRVAQLLVMWELERRQERAPILNQSGLGTIALVNLVNIQDALMNPAAPGVSIGFQLYYNVN